MSNDKQISVEWLVEQIKKDINLRLKGFDIDKALEQAKAMHKEECVDLLNHHNDIFDTSEEHYNETFK